MNYNIWKMVLKILYRNITCFEKFAGRTAVIKKVGFTHVRKIGTRTIALTLSFCD